MLLLYGFGFFRHGDRRQMAFLVVDLLDAVARIGFLVPGITAEVQSLAIRCPDHGVAGDRLMSDFGEVFGSASGRPVIDQAPLQFSK